MRLVADPVRPQITAPTACPFCRSLDLKTTSKILDESTYWRCLACGEIWNPGRLKSRGSVNRLGQR
jgi:ribosomal protein L37AE/L43A